MTPEFNRWWDADELMQTNPYPDDTPVCWAWEGWQAARAESAKEIEELRLALDNRIAIIALNVQQIAELKAQVEGMRNVLKSVSNFTYENQGHSDRACCSTEDGFPHAPDCEVMNAIAQEKQND